MIQLQWDQRDVELLSRTQECWGIRKKAACLRTPSKQDKQYTAKIQKQIYPGALASNTTIQTLSTLILIFAFSANGWWNTVLSSHNSFLCDHKAWIAFWTVSYMITAPTLLQTWPPHLNLPWIRCNSEIAQFNCIISRCQLQHQHKTHHRKQEHPNSLCFQNSLVCKKYHFPWKFHKTRIVQRRAQSRAGMLVAGLERSSSMILCLMPYRYQLGSHCHFSSDLFHSQKLC